MAAYLQHAFTDRADQVGEPGANPFLLEEENLDTDTFAYARSELSDGSSPGATIEDALLEELLRSSEEGGDTAASPPCAPSSPARGAVPKDKDAGGRTARKGSSSGERGSKSTDLHCAEEAGAEGLFEVQLSSVSFEPAFQPRGGAYAVVRCPLSAGPGLKVWLPARALAGAAGGGRGGVSVYCPVPAAFFEAAGGGAHELVVELWADEAPAPARLVGLARVPLRPPGPADEYPAQGRGQAARRSAVLAQGAFEVYNPLIGRTSGRLEARVAAGAHDEEPEVSPAGRAVAENGEAEGADTVEGAQAHPPSPPAPSSRPPRGGAHKPPELPGQEETRVQDEGRAGQEAMAVCVAAEPLHGSETTVQHTFEVTIASITDCGPGGLADHAPAGTIGRYVCYSFPDEEDDDLCTEVVAATPSAEFHASVCHTLHLGAGDDPAVACQAGSKSLRFELWEKAADPTGAADDVFVAVAELPLADVVALAAAKAPEEERDFELEMSPPSGPAVPLRGRPVLRVAVRHWGGRDNSPGACGADAPPAHSLEDAEEAAGMEREEQREAWDEAAAGAKETAAGTEEAAAGAEDEAERAEEAAAGAEDEAARAEEAAVEADFTKDEVGDAEGGGEEGGTVSVAGSEGPPASSGGASAADAPEIEAPLLEPCRVHVHVRRACGLRAALEEAELAGVRRDGSSALTEAVERGPNPFAEFDLGLPDGDSTPPVRTQFDVETCSPAFNFHADLDFALDAGALAHLADGACRVALLHRGGIGVGGGGGSGPDEWDLCSCEVPLFPLLTAPGGLSGWFTLLTPAGEAAGAVELCVRLARLGSQPLLAPAPAGEPSSPPTPAFSALEARPELLRLLPAGSRAVRAAGSELLSLATARVDACVFVEDVVLSQEEVLRCESPAATQYSVRYRFPGALEETRSTPRGAMVLHSGLVQAQMAHCAQLSVASPLHFREHLRRQAQFEIQLLREEKRSSADAEVVGRSFVDLAPLMTQWDAAAEGPGGAAGAGRELGRQAVPVVTTRWCTGLYPVVPAPEAGGAAAGMKMRVKVFVDALPSALTGAGAGAAKSPLREEGEGDGAELEQGTPDLPAPAAGPAADIEPKLEPNVHVGVETALHLLLNETADRGWLRGLHSCVFVTYEWRETGATVRTPLAHCNVETTSSISMKCSWFHTAHLPLRAGADPASTAPAPLAPSTLAAAAPPRPSHALLRAGRTASDERVLLLKLWHRQLAAAPSAVELDERAEVRPDDKFVGCAAMDLSPLFRGLTEICGWYNVVDHHQHSRGQLKVRVGSSSGKPLRGRPRGSGVGGALGAFSSAAGPPSGDGGCGSAAGKVAAAAAAEAAVEELNIPHDVLQNVSRELEGLEEALRARLREASGAAAAPPPPDTAAAAAAAAPAEEEETAAEGSPPATPPRGAPASSAARARALASPRSPSPSPSPGRVCWADISDLSPDAEPFAAPASLSSPASPSPPASPSMPASPLPQASTLPASPPPASAAAAAEAAAGASVLSLSPDAPGPSAGWGARPSPVRYGVRETARIERILGKKRGG